MNVIAEVVKKTVPVLVSIEVPNPSFILNDLIFTKLIQHFRLVVRLYFLDEKYVCAQRNGWETSHASSRFRVYSPGGWTYLDKLSRRDIRTGRTLDPCNSKRWQNF